MIINYTSLLTELSVHAQNTTWLTFQGTMKPVEGTKLLVPTEVSV